ncbi:MAG: ribosome biogenesis GTPase Der [Candidatus Dadabacteria bacterium]|nr:MAG: ribosome biogenesis GTPase Der [Candidatus Dadabacteria bacterium]
MDRGRSATQKAGAGMKTVLLVGRPNVGKSTLFNRLTRTRAALIDDREGVTRDWIERPWTLPGDRTVMLRDLCGFREDEPDPVLQQSQATMQRLWAEADLLLLVVDARDGVTETDRWLAQAVRASGKPVLLIASKADHERAEMEALAAAELGWEPIPVSAAHNRGIGELESAVEAALPLEEAVETVSDDETLKIAILGKPNAGKSTLLNRLLGYERATVSDIAGTTRDPVDAEADWAGFHVRFVDTAGVRRKRSIDDQLEAATVSRSLKAVRDADVVLYLIDATEGVTQQDQTLLSRVTDTGRGLLILFSQWDRVEDPERRIRQLEGERERMLPFVEWAPSLTISAMTGHNMVKIERRVRDIVQQLDTTVSTSRLNDILQQIIAENPPPAVQIRTSRRRKRHKPFKLYYGTQSGTRPLRFKLFCNVKRDQLPPSYQRYLLRRLREHLGLDDVPALLYFEDRR